MTSTTPDWLTRDYVLQALQHHHNNLNLKLLKLNVVPALGKGENYGGILTRLKTTYSLDDGHGKEVKHQRNFVLKSSLASDPFCEEKMRPYDIFNREISIYDNVLPKITALLHSAYENDDGNDSTQQDNELFASVIHVDYDKQALIFEDLSDRGYVMADRVKCLDSAHIELILKKLAKLHAASAVLNEKTNGSLELYDRGFFNRYTDNYSSYFVGMIVACGRFLREWPDYEEYSCKLLALEPYYMDIGKRCFAPTPGEVNVLCHGDLWTNNVMFKYNRENGKPIDVLLIDFQYTFWGSPTLDMHHFFNTSMQEPLRLFFQEKFIQYYHEHFANTLRKLKYRSLRIPSLFEFSLQVEKKRFFAFHSAIAIQPVMINENSDDADFSAIMADDERANNFRKSVYENKIVQRNLKTLLPYFNRRGLLDSNQSD